jgi:ubiquitin-conjugating enzyme E2 variant
MHFILQIIIGFLLADFITGIFHWFEDTYLDYCINIPLLSTVSKDNALHHYFPRSIIGYSYFENIQISLYLVIIIAGIIFICNKKFMLRYNYLFIVFFFFSTIANVIHRYSHMRECENHVVITLLQKTGILCSHEHHSIHHVNSDERYCVITEFNNAILDRLYFWRALENIIYLTTGITPNRKMKYNEHYELHNYMHENAKLECPDTPTTAQIQELIHKLQEYKKCAK